MKPGFLHFLLVITPVSFAFYVIGHSYGAASVEQVTEVYNTLDTNYVFFALDKDTEHFTIENPTQCDAYFVRINEGGNFFDKPREDGQFLKPGESINLKKTEQHKTVAVAAVSIQQPLPILTQHKEDDDKEEPTS